MIFKEKFRMGRGDYLRFLGGLLHSVVRKKGSPALSVILFYETSVPKGDQMLLGLKSMLNVGELWPRLSEEKVAKRSENIARARLFRRHLITMRMR